MAAVEVGRVAEVTGIIVFRLLLTLLLVLVFVLLLVFVFAFVFVLSVVLSIPLVRVLPLPLALARWALITVELVLEAFPNALSRPLPLPWNGSAAAFPGAVW